MLTDIYVINQVRERVSIDKFMTSILNGMRESAETYDYPYLSDEHTDELRLSELLDRMLSKDSEEYTIYWKADENQAEVRNALLSFLPDGSVVVGTSISSKNDDKVRRYLSNLAGTVDAKFGFATVEEPPPEGFEIFVNLAKASAGPVLLDGNFY